MSVITTQYLSIWVALSPLLSSLLLKSLPPALQLEGLYGFLSSFPLVPERTLGRAGNQHREDSSAPSILTAGVW